MCLCVRVDFCVFVCVVKGLKLRKKIEGGLQEANKWEGGTTDTLAKEDIRG